MSVADGSGLFGAGAKVIGANRAKKAAQQTKKDARKQRAEGLEFAAGLDWEPELLGNHAPVYQRSQSPIADAFLQSLITGQNPAAVQGTRQGAGRLKAGAQRNFDRSTGGFGALRARQQQMEQAMPWTPKPFSGPAVTDQDRWAVQAPGLARGGISREQDRTLRSGGIELDPVTATDSKGVAGTQLLGGQTIWGTKMGPGEYARLADAQAVGDKDLYMRILKGEA